MRMRMRVRIAHAHSDAVHCDVWKGIKRPGINGAYVIYEGVKLFMITLFFRHYIQNMCILRNRLINFITVNLKHG